MVLFKIMNFVDSMSVIMKKEHPAVQRKQNILKLKKIIR